VDRLLVAERESSEFIMWILLGLEGGSSKVSGPRPQNTLFIAVRKIDGIS
jgi:hypothetical protein